ncbi:MAG: glycosyltransferase family 2 protein [Promethearchaeota archaeon]
MGSKKYDLAVAYRIYPKVSGTPPILANDKYNLAKICLKSFKACLGDLKVKIYALLDKCPKQYEKLFENSFEKEDLKIIRLNGIGNKGTFNLQLKILLEQNDSDFVYFAEDDYYYLSDQFKKMILFLKNDAEVHFVTPYDHLDHYNYHFHNYKSKIRAYAQKHWRTIHSTCATFLTTKQILHETRKILQIYTKNTILLSSWVCLTKFQGLKPFTLLNYYLNDRRLFHYIYKAWRHGWKQILFGKKWNLWCPMPTIGTHMEKEHLSPIIDWDTIFTKEIESL